MAIIITWTKEWSSADDGTILSGSHLGDLQSDIEGHSHTTSSSLAGLSDILISGAAVGDLLTYNGSKWVNIHVGATGSVLKSNGTGATPSFQAITTMSGFGTWTAKSSGTSYLAATDGILTVEVVDAGSGSYATILTDGSNPPTTVRGRPGANSSGSNVAMGSCPVKKNDYYKVNFTTGGDGTCTIFWLPFVY